jgi:hypothetical protein
VSFFIYKHITATGFTNICGPNRTDVGVNYVGLLHGLVLNQYSTAAGSTSLVTIIDGTTTAASSAANVIAIASTAGVNSTDYIYDLEFMNGLSIVIGGGATPVDVTVVYR